MWPATGEEAVRLLIPGEPRKPEPTLQDLAAAQQPPRADCSPAPWPPPVRHAGTAPGRSPVSTLEMPAVFLALRTPKPPS